MTPAWESSGVAGTLPVMTATHEVPAPLLPPWVAPGVD